MHKKHMFLRVFSKITIFACVFCVFSACADTTTCDIDYTPVTGNSWQNGTPTTTNPVAIESIGTKVGNKYAVQVAVNYDGGVVDLGTLNWEIYSGAFYADIVDKRTSELISGNPNRIFSSDYIVRKAVLSSMGSIGDGVISEYTSSPSRIVIKDVRYSTSAEFKAAMSGKYLYYQRSTDETWTAPTLKTVYLDEPLRKVGGYADVLDYKNGTITRNVGVKVLDGTESGWVLYAGSGEHAGLVYNEELVTDNKLNISVLYMFATHFKTTQNVIVGINETRFQGVPTAVSHRLYMKRQATETVDTFKAFLASEYANGTPVTVYYPLATPVVEQIENWSCTPPITDIQIATTKFVDDEFAVAEANLATTVQTIESVVSRTIAQTGQIATLHETKQTRPDENCPANMKCLLVQDEDGTPHWYPIIEP